VCFTSQTHRDRDRDRERERERAYTALAPGREVACVDIRAVGQNRGVGRQGTTQGGTPDQITTNWSLLQPGYEVLFITRSRHHTLAVIWSDYNQMRSFLGSLLLKRSEHKFLTTSIKSDHDVIATRFARWACDASTHTAENRTMEGGTERGK
jgi:hypothetical protein